jgi:hypothetical protein
VYKRREGRVKVSLLWKKRIGVEGGFRRTITSPSVDIVHKVTFEMIIPGDRSGLLG